MKQNRRGFLMVAGAAVAVGALPLPALAARKTKIGIVGSGRVGSALGAAWVKAGHEVMFSSLNIEDDESARRPARGECACRNAAGRRGLRRSGRRSRCPTAPCPRSGRTWGT